MNDATIEETFDILDVPEAARNDTTLFVMMSAFIQTPQGREAARETGFTQFFEDCTADYDEREMGHWPVRDYAMRVEARHIGSIAARMDARPAVVPSNLTTPSTNGRTAQAER